MEHLLLSLDLGEALVAIEAEWERLRKPWAETPDPDLSFSLEEGEMLSTALLLGWHRTRFSSFLEEFEILSIEKETPCLLAPNVTLQARADAVVRRKADGMVFVFNWKTSSKKDGWTSQWEDDVQAWTEALATEDSLGEKVAGVFFEGFYKGQLRDGMWSSPLLYGWRLGESSIYSATYERYSKEKPWRKFATWKERFPFGEGLASWISWIQAKLVGEQFLRTPPILKNDEVVQDWIAQVVRRETDIERLLENGSPEDISAFFWQNFKGWNCERCIFRRACKKQASLEELVEQGLLVRREDHHGPRA